MPFWRNCAGKLIVNSLGKLRKCLTWPCKEKPTVSCSGCTQPVPAEVTVDFGSGGWINNQCNYCESIIGEFVISNVASGPVCRYDHFATVCPFSWPSCGLNTTLTIRVQITSTSCTVTVTFGRPLSSNCGLADTSATYTGSFSDSTCRELLQLTKTNETVGTYCTGSLPNTITVDTR